MIVDRITSLCNRTGLPVNETIGRAIGLLELMLDLHDIGGHLEAHQPDGTVSIVVLQ